MKTFKTGILAVIVAIGALAFTNNKFDSNAKTTSFYWFPLDAATGNPQTVNSQPMFLSTDPYSCPGGSKYCGGGYNGFIDNHNGTYSASGNRVVTEKKP